MLPQPDQEFVEEIADELNYQKSSINKYLSGKTSLPPKASVEILMEYGAAADLEVREKVYTTILESFGERIQTSENQYLTSEEGARDAYRLLKNVDLCGSSAGLAAGTVYSAQIFYGWRKRKNLVSQPQLAEITGVSGQTVRNNFKELQEINSKSNIV